MKPKTLPSEPALSKYPRIWKCFIIILTALVIADVSIPNAATAHMAAETYFWFFPMVGLASSLVLIFVARALGKLLKRREDYWEGHH